MEDLLKAKMILESQSKTCVCCCGETVYTSEKSGISPPVDLISQNIDLKGFSVADKIIGKAAALLFVLAGVKAVYGEVMSRSAADVFERFGITYTNGTLTDSIINRAGNGLCPMETAVLNINDPKEAYNAVVSVLNA